MTRRTFHFVEGTSSKFWSIEVSGTKTLVHFGKIGTAGQAQEKDWPSEASAVSAAEKLIAEKTRKGYLEQAAAVAAALMPAPAVRQAKAAPAAQPAPVGGAQAKPPAAQAIRFSERQWRWASWRPWQKLPQPKAVPFDFNDCVSRFREVSGGGEWVWRRDWRKAKLRAGMSEAEAEFWLRAIGCDGGEKALKVSLSKAPLMGIATAAHFESALTGDRYAAAVYGPILGALPCVRALETAADWQSGWNRFGGKLAAELIVWVLPHLDEEAVATARRLMTAKLEAARAPRGKAEDWYGPLQIAALLGCHDLVAGIVKSMLTGCYGSSVSTGASFIADPAPLLGGLASPDDFVREALRLEVLPRSVESLEAWIACSETRALSALEPVFSIRNVEECERMVKVMTLVDSPEMTRLMLLAQVADRGKAAALAWIHDHAAAIIPELVREASAPDTGAAAVAWLRQFCREGHRQLIESAAESAGTEAGVFIRMQVLEAEAPAAPFHDDSSLDPALAAALRAAPGNFRLPPWAVSGAMPQIISGDKAIPPDLVDALTRMLAKQSIPEPDLLRAQLNPSSLDRFLWALFEAWLNNDATSKDKWALLALGHLGSDAIALKLAPLIRKWPGESQHQRAVTGLQVLRAIGTDTALMQLNGIAQKVPFKGLKDRARELMEEIAKDRGLTKAQLEDRIVPDCGLDERGSRTFDFGPRQFEFLLGSDLKPAVREASGKRRPDLPAPNAQDDPALSSRAVEDWKLLKKTLREILKIQTTRMEQAMVTGRRWTAEEFEMLLLRHPLMTHLARWVVWACYGQDGRPLQTFRVTEDQTLADASDNTFALQESKQESGAAGPAASIGIVHPYHLTEAEKSAWGQIFGDYEIIQPFPQLSRPVLAPTSAEASAETITRAAGCKIPAGSLFGVFEKGGWQRDKPADAGGYSAHSKQFPAAGITAFAHYDPGFWIGGSMAEMDDQELTEVYFVPGLMEPGWWSHHQKRTPLAQVDPIALSEVLADVETLIGKAK